MNNRKSQSAVEFISMYGVALIIAITAISAIIYITIPTSKISPATCSFSSGIECAGTQVSSLRTHVVLVNHLETALYVTSVTLPDYPAVPCTYDPVWLLDAPNKISCDVTSLNLKDKTKLKVRISYSKEDGGLTRVINGEFFNYVTAPNMFGLTVGVGMFNGGRGGVFTSDGKISCSSMMTTGGSICYANFPEGSIVSMTIQADPTPNPTSDTIKKILGCESFSGGVCTVTINGPTFVSVTFEG